MAECVKRLCSGCNDELLAASLKFPDADNFTEANDGNKKFGFPECFGEEGEGFDRQCPYKYGYLAHE